MRWKRQKKLKGRAIVGHTPKLTPLQQREAIKRRDEGGETLRSIGRSYNVSAKAV